MSTENGEELSRRIETGEFRIPPIPEIAFRVTELASDPNVSSEAIAELVHRDPGLTSELLRYANSAALGAQAKIVSVRHAIVHLGINTVAQVALAASLRSGVFDAPAYANLVKLHWKRSIGTALVAKRIARQLTQSVEVSFLCGLLWNVGSMLVLRALSEPVRKKSAVPVDDEAELLAEELNMRFREAATEAWNLPPVVSGALLTRDDSAEPSIEADIAALSYDIALVFLNEDPFDVSIFATRPEADRLNLYPEQLEEIGANLEEFREELEAMP